jgi:C-terminal processing protease CtpA/Prc
MDSLNGNNQGTQAVVKNSGCLIFRGVLIVATLSFAACGGGGSSTAIGPGTPSGYQPGVFLDADTFYAQCQVPRSGIDPATNQAYPDVQGSTTDENNFLRSYSNDTYLWYAEITDRDPSAYNDTLDYFDLLVTNATTPSGQLKDKFHFTYDSEEYFQLSQGGVSSGYGAQWAVLSSTVPRDIRIAYTEPNSPATNLAQPLARGARIMSVDGFDIDTNTQAGVDALNAGLFPSGVGETHSFGVQDLGSNVTRTVTMMTASITSDPVQDVQVFDTPTGFVGYMLFNDHIATAEQALIDAVNQLNSGQGIDDLVLDIRYNGGGYLAIASELAYMIAGPSATAGQTFEELQFNDKHPVTNPITGRALSPTPFYDRTLGDPFNAPPNQALPTLDLPRVFVLTGSGTCSASEAVMNGLRGIGVEVIQIGSTTCGKPYGFYEARNCGTSYFTIQFRGVNALGFGDYTDGFSPTNTPANLAGTVIPGCSIADDFTEQLGSVQEDRLAMALAYRDGQSCSGATGSAPSGVNQAAGPPRNTDVVVPKSPWHTNRILLP